jgi:hypothetical protein
MTELIAYLPSVFPALPYAGNSGGNTNDFANQFDLTDTICVTAVGAFDANQDGFANDIAVALWLDTGTLIDGSDATFTSSDAGDLDEGGIFRWKSLDVPFELTVGTYFVSAAGFGTDDQYVFANGAKPIQEGDDALDFTGVYNYASHAESQPSFPTNQASGYYYLRGNFKFLIGDCPVNKKKKKKNNKNRQIGKKGKRDGKKGKKD